MKFHSSSFFILFDLQATCSAKQNQNNTIQFRKCEW